LYKTGYTWKKGSYLKETVTVEKKESHLEKWVILGKISYTRKKEPHLEKWDKLGKMAYT